MRLLKHGILASSFQVPSGALTFRSFSVPGTEGNIGTSSGQGLIRTMGASPLDNWVFSYWVRNLQNAAARTHIAGTTGREQVFEGTANTLTCRSNNISTGTSNATGYTGDTWVHVLVIYNFTTNQRSITIDNGTPLSTTDASSYLTYELNDANFSLHLIQDDGEDADADAIFFDIIGLNSSSSLIGTVPTDINYSTTGGGQWTEFSDFGNVLYGDESFGIGGTVVGDFSSGTTFSDYSGNGNDFTQSGAPTNRIVNRTGDAFGGVPPGA